MSDIYVFVGASGSGKTTIVNSIFGDNVILSTTTRPIRENESDGIDYNFVTDAEFENMLLSGQFIESAIYGGNRYGILERDISDRLNNDVGVVLTIDGANKLKEMYGERVTTIFVYVDKDSVEKMLADRGMSNEEIKQRVDLFDDDTETMKSCDYIVQNVYGEFEDCLSDINKIINGKKDRPKYVAIDFDGTIVEDRFPKIGKIKPYAKQVISQFRTQGGIVLINTCRDGEHEALVKEFLTDNGIGFDCINEGHSDIKETYGNDPRKLGADLYIDDKSYGIVGESNINWLKIADILNVKVGDLD